MSYTRNEKCLGLAAVGLFAVGVTAAALYARGQRTNDDTLLPPKLIRTKPRLRTEEEAETRKTVKGLERITFGLSG